MKAEKIYASYASDTLPCVWCGKSLHIKMREVTVEHIVCRSLGKLLDIGRVNTLDNCRVCCYACNQKRGNFTECEIYSFHLWNNTSTFGRNGEKENVLAKIGSIKNFNDIYIYIVNNRSPNIDWNFVAKLKNHPLQQYYADLVKSKMGLEIYYGSKA